jgi:hypothetical protein
MGFGSKPGRSRPLQGEHSVHKNCLNEETFTNYLEDGLQASARTAAEGHLISCDTCRNRLVYYMRILDEDIREDEEPVLEAAMRRWEAKASPVAVRAAGVGQSSLFLKLAVAAALVGAIALGAVTGLFSPPVASSGDYLEAVLREDRPFRFRTSLQESTADYTEFFETRDAGGPSSASRGAFEALLERAGQSSARYHLLGLSYLILERDADRAVDYLQMAVNEFRGDPHVQNDLGVAYLERRADSAVIRENDVSLARAHFEAAIDLDADFMPARFNLVILAMEDGSGVDTRSAADAYFINDPDSLWADELRAMVGSGDI